MPWPLFLLNWIMQFASNFLIKTVAYRNSAVILQAVYSIPLNDNKDTSALYILDHDNRNHKSVRIVKKTKTGNYSGNCKFNMINEIN